MNYLAHAYLSFNEPEIITGNMISDFIKGNKKLAYISGIQNGIMLHRAIDEFTDNHPATKQAKEFFRKEYRLYSGAFVDIVYDYFLANDTNEFSDKAALKLFASDTYGTLQNYSGIFPEHFGRFFNYMQKEDWLYNYQHTWFIQKTFEGLTRRALYMSDPTMAVRIFAQHHSSLQDCYNVFFPELKTFAFTRFTELLKN